MFVVRTALKLCVLILIKQVMYSFYAFISVWIHGFLFFFLAGLYCCYLFSSSNFPHLGN